MNEKSNNKQPEVYEFMDPGARFVSLAREAMRRHDQDPDANLDSGPISVTWPASEEGDHYTLQKDYVQGNALVAYILDHFASEYSSTKPYRRYFVAADETKAEAPTTKIVQIDHKSMPIMHNGPDTPGWQRNIAKTALAALGAQAPELATKLIDQRFEKYFGAYVANYILSDHAVEGADQELTPDVARESIATFHERIQKIADDAVKHSKKYGPNGHMLSTAYTDAVVDAASHRRDADGKNHYRAVDYSKVVLTVANDIKKWQHLVSAKDIFSKEKGLEQA